MTLQDFKITRMIRRANSDDAALLADLGCGTFDETFAEFNKPEDLAAYYAEAFSVEKQATELADTDVTFFIAEIEGRAAGYAKLQKGDAPSCVTGEKPCELARLYISKEWFGRGIGAALMEACVTKAQEAGYKTLWLGVWEKNERAKAFYRKWGFREAGSHIFMLGSDAQTDLLLERAL
ncbi:MAG: N-acetyltransferase [Pyrinomonadaceae bacterium]